MSFLYTADRTQFSAPTRHPYLNTQPNWLFCLLICRSVIPCFYTGITPTQLHRYDSLGCIDIAAVLKPLDFLLPQREILTLPPVSTVDVANELNSLKYDTQPKEPVLDLDSALPDSSPKETELESLVAQTEPYSADQDNEMVSD